MATLSSQIISECIAFRRALHQEPELSGLEFKTRDRLVAELQAAGLEVQTFPDSTGIVALWPGQDRTRSIAFRADMDALPMVETSELPWASQSNHAMHACGHDGHSSILLGFAKHLGQGGKAYATDIKLLFQPAEESGNGARRMVADGVLNFPTVSAIFGLHGWPDLSLGLIGVHGEAVMASVDNFEITVHGRGGHGAQPHHAKDPILGAAQILLAAQTLVSRSTDPIEASVLTIGHFQGGRTYNVIPETCLMRGTLRTHNELLRKKLKTALKNLCHGQATSLGLEVELAWVEECPALVNDSAMAELAKRALQKALGESAIVEPKPSMAGEDFPFFMEVQENGIKVPGAYLWLGLGNERGSLHNPRFDFNDKALEIGIQLFMAILEEYSGSLAPPSLPE